MEFTGELPDNEIEGVVEGWVDSNLDSHIEAWLENHDFADSIDVEGQIRSLLDDFTPGGAAVVRHARLRRQSTASWNSVVRLSSSRTWMASPGRFGMRSPRWLPKKWNGR